MTSQIRLMNFLKLTPKSSFRLGKSSVNHLGQKSWPSLANGAAPHEVGGKRGWCRAVNSPSPGQFPGVHRPRHDGPCWTLTRIIFLIIIHYMIK